MLFSDATVLSYNHQSQFFGDEIIRYRTTKEISVQGLLQNLTNGSGVSGIISGIYAIESAAKDWTPIVINGTNFGSGYFSNISFDEGIDVRTKSYTIDLVIPESGSINNLPTNDSYAGISYTNFKFIDSMSESLSLSRDFETDNYTHSIDVKVNSSNITGSIGFAKAIAKNLFESNTFNGYIGNYYGISGKKSTYEESYDKINGECSFNQATTFFSNASGNYSINKSYSYSRETNGVATVKENGDITALAQPYLEVLTNAYNVESANSYANCLEVFNAYKESDTYPLLNSAPIIKGSSLSRYEQRMSYDHTYSNDLSINSGYFWTYTHDSSLSENGEIITKEAGSIVGRGHRIDTKYANAVAAWSIIEPDIDYRSDLAYDRYLTFITLPDPSTNFILLNSSETHQKHIGSIEYSRDYSNDQTLVNDTFIRQAKTTVSEQFQLPISQNFNIVNYGEIEQVSDSYRVSSVGVEVELKGKRNTTMDYYLTYAKGLAATASASVGVDFLTNASYSLSPFASSFSLSAEWGKIYEVT